MSTKATTVSEKILFTLASDLFQSQSLLLLISKLIKILKQEKIKNRMRMLKRTGKWRASKKYLSSKIYLIVMGSEKNKH